MISSPNPSMTKLASRTFIRFSVCTALAITSLCSGCYRVRLEAPVSGGSVVEERNNFFLFGMIGDPEVDLPTECPRGVTSFGDEFRPSDILFTILSLGLYSPKTSIIKCAA